MQLTIEKMIYGGDGLARLPSPDDPRRGKAVFLPFVLEGERVDAALTEQKPGFARAEAQKILQPSSHRTDPPCPYFFQCGGCQYQHSTYEHQLEMKTAILRETLRRTAKLEFADEVHIHAAEPWHYRNRTRLRVRAAPEFALGYNRFNSHELLPVRECPISSPLINRAIADVWKVGEDGRISPAVRELEFFANAENDRLLLELYGDPQDVGAGQSSQTFRSAEALAAAMPYLASVHALPHDQTSAESPASIVNEDFVYRTARAEYHVGAGAFFQANRFLTDQLNALVCDGRSGQHALDLYAGAGLFSVPLAQTFAKVTAVESAPPSFRDLQRNAPRNLKAVQSQTDQFLTRAPKPRPDLVVLDPPRSGLSDRAVQQLIALAPPRITYVSCNPATLARDLRMLLAGGYRTEMAHLIDLFPQTFHIESVFHLVR